jgi:hypothetical protein
MQRAKREEEVMVTTAVARPALEQHWQRYLDGAIGYDEAFVGVVDVLQP